MVLTHFWRMYLCAEGLGVDDKAYIVAKVATFGLTFGAFFLSAMAVCTMFNRMCQNSALVGFVCP